MKAILRGQRVPGTCLVISHAGYFIEKIIMNILVQLETKVNTPIKIRGRSSRVVEGAACERK